MPFYAVGFHSQGGSVMTFSPPLSSAFNDTRNRSRHLSPQSGMCSFCTEECEGTCEIALAAVLGAQAVALRGEARAL